MNEEKHEKITIVSTYGGEDPERATYPFLTGNAALAMDVAATIVLQGNGVTAATKGMYEHVHAPGQAPLKQLVDQFVELGGTLLVCIPCMEARSITKDQLVVGAQPVKSARLVTEILESGGSVTY
jgi:uncharacterized protein involved in oxidation of intracellular sulfur